MVFDHSQQTTEEQARKNRGRDNDGKISQVEDTTPLDDDYDVNIRLAGSGVVYDFARSHTSAGGTCKRCDWSYDRCICGVAGSRKRKG